MVEALYFKTYHSFLIGNIVDTKMFFEFLISEFNKRKNHKALTYLQLKELKKIKLAIETGNVETRQWIDEPSVPVTTTNDAPEIKQPELLKKIHIEGFKDIIKLLQEPMLELYNVEHPCNEYGAVDMVYRGEETVYPIEVKRHEGKHDLLGQIGKYTLYFKLNLHLKHYTKVQPLTICNSYNPHTLAELKRMSVIPLKYDIVDDGIKIRRM